MNRAPAQTLKFIGEANSESAYLHSIRNSRKLTGAEERAVAARIEQGDKQAVNILVSANLKFVVSVCRNYRNRGLPFGDLINEGNLGLIRAAQRFDARKDCRFISYAVWWIRQGILVAISEQTRFLKVAPGRVQAMLRIAKAGNRLEQALGRSLRAEELAADLNLSVEKLAEYMQLSAKSVSLSMPGPEGGPGLEETLEDPSGVCSDDGADAFLMRKNMALLLDTLDGRKAEVLKLFYGVGYERALPLTEIAARFNLTRERVRQIKASALSLLKRSAGAPAKARPSGKARLFESFQA